MLVTPKNGTACLTFAVVMVATVMIHLTSITAYRTNGSLSPVVGGKSPYQQVARRIFGSGAVWPERRCAYGRSLGPLVKTRAFGMTPER
jgi:hypothetical protein